MKICLNSCSMLTMNIKIFRIYTVLLEQRVNRKLQVSLEKKPKYQVKEYYLRCRHIYSVNPICILYRISCLQLIFLSEESC